MKTKILLLVSILMLVTTMIGAQEKKMALGINTEISLANAHDSIAATTTTTDTIAFKPFFALMLSEKTELDLFVYIGSSVVKVNNVVSGINEFTTIGAGAGILQHLLVGKIFDFSTGFDATIATILNPQYNIYSRLNIVAALPVVLDIKLSETFRFRIKHTVASVSLITSTTQLNNFSTVNKNTTFAFDSYHTTGGPLVELGFMFWF